MWPSISGLFETKLVRQQNGSCGMVHDISGHATEQELPVVTVRLGAHNDQARLI